MKTVNIAKIETMGMLDGPGIRTIAFTQGCILRCAYCHNPRLLAREGGTPYTVQELYSKIERYKPYYGADGGVTVSGGEPLIHTEFLTEFFKKCKQNGISTCLDTSAASPAEFDFDELLKYVDTVLLDIKHTTNEGFEELTLSSKQKTKAFREALGRSDSRVWIRQVILPNYNDNQNYLNALLTEIKPIKNVDRIEFLPYHTMAENIYEDIGMQYRLKGVDAMDAEKCKELNNKFLEMYRPFNPRV